MQLRTWTRTGIAILILAVTAGCERSTTGLEEAKPNADPVVFDDDFGNAVDYQAFMGSKTNAVLIDLQEFASGNAALKVTVPPPSDPEQNWAGGAFVSSLSRYLADFNALTFWAKASQPMTLDVVGLANDNTGTSLYEASWREIPLTTEWQYFEFPIPLPQKLDRERGMFYFAEGGENDEGYTVWFDEVVFDSVTTISDTRPAIETRELSSFVGATFNIGNGTTTFRVGDADLEIEHMPAYFDFTSSDLNVAVVDDGQITAVGGGNAVITARLGNEDATGAITIKVSAPPGDPAPAPTLPDASVISLFSDVYTDVPVDKWSADWDRAEVIDFSIAGDAVKVYTDLVYAGIEFTSQTVDATDMTHIHLDIWFPEGSLFRVKLVDFGADGIYGGERDSEHEVTIPSGTDPPLETGQWVSLDIPLSTFTRLTSRAHLAQLVISGDTPTVYVDNIYFHK